MAGVSPWWGPVRHWWLMLVSAHCHCHSGCHLWASLIPRLTVGTQHLPEHTPSWGCFNPGPKPCHHCQPASQSIPSLVLLLCKHCKCNRFVVTEEASPAVFILIHQNICRACRQCAGRSFLPLANMIWAEVLVGFSQQC